MTGIRAPALGEQASRVAPAVALEGATRGMDGGMPIEPDDQPLPRPEAVDLAKRPRTARSALRRRRQRRAVTVSPGCEAPLQLEAGDAAAFLRHRPQAPAPRAARMAAQEVRH